MLSLLATVKERPIAPMVPPPMLGASHTPFHSRYRGFQMGDIHAWKQTTTIITLLCTMRTNYLLNPPLPPSQSPPPLHHALEITFLHAYNWLSWVSLGYY